MKSNKALKDAYKQQQFKMGVFQVRNTVSGKIFVGSSVNLVAIWNRIKAELKLDGHRNPSLQMDWKTFGEESFSFEILSEIRESNDHPIDYAKEVKVLEAMFIAELQPFGDKGYNSRKAS